jgi:hypothetical protein
MSKKLFDNAKRNKADEFYTQLPDIEAEMRHYKDQFRGKVIFCNCDDPFESNFFKYFAMNFNFLGLKKLISTCYSESPVAAQQLSLFDVKNLEVKNGDGKHPYKIEITEVSDENADGAVDLIDVEYLLKNRKNTLTLLKDDGDFRSAECIELLKESDVVVTNPPFSLFREYIAQIVKYDKKFLVIGNTNALSYTDIFKIIKENKLRTGYTNFNVGMYFYVPDHWENYHKIENGRKMVRVSTSCWLTNLYVEKHKEFITLYKQYTPKEYPHYDNYDAIEVSKTADIPYDWDGVMGVPITFLDKFNPEQFEILGWTRGTNEFEATPTKRYVNAKQIKNGVESNGGKVNTGPTILLKQKPTDTFYTADNAKGYLVQPYMRILIRNKNPKK